MTRQRVLLTGVLLAILLLALALPATIAQMPTPTPNLETQVWQEFTQTAQVTVSPNYTATLEALRTEAVLTLTAAVATPTPVASEMGRGTGIFAVTLIENNRAGDIYLVDTTDTSLIPLLDYDNQGDLGPTWSPDGQQLAYQSIRGATGGIFVRDMPTGSERHISSGYEMRPVWSPDGAWIAMEGNEGAQTDLFVVAADCGQGTDCVRLNITQDDALDAGISWSPDGRRLAYVTDRGLRRTLHIYLVDVDGSNKRPLVDVNTEAWMPDWSPDGTLIAYTSEEDIYTANATCTQPVSTGPNGEVQGCATAIRRLTQSGDASRPVWSPDGTRIAYLSGRGLYLNIMNADGSRPLMLLQQPVPITDLSWSPDGTQIAFVSSVGDLHLTSVSDGVARTLVMDAVHLASRLVWQPGS